jgi:hypothetical protein
MSMIDDIVSKKLPTGRNFQAKVGAGNVQKKLYDATRSGALKNLADNQDVINEIAQKRQADIRGGRYGSDKRKSDYRNALKDKNLSADDRKDLEAILEHWSKGEVKKENTVKTNSPSVKKEVKRVTRISPKKVDFHSPVAPFNMELPDFLKKRRGSISILGNSSASQPYRPGSGGGINAGLGGSTSASANNAGSTFKAPPRLLK